jgi:lysophospholipase L1-like esterase
METTLNRTGAARGPGLRLREWAGNALAFLISLLVVYGAMELYVSVAVDDGMQFDLEMWRYARDIKRQSASPAIGHEHTPNTHARLMGVDVAISSQGLRDREFPPAPPPGRTRILMLGDSLAFGWGVPQDKTSSKLLEQKLLEAGHDAEVINTGVGNYNTEMEVAYFLERGAKFNPHYVVLNYFINDAEPTPRDRSNILTRNLRALVYFASRADMALRMANVGEHKDWRTYYAELYGPDGVRRVSEAVAQLAEYCRRNGIRLLLANQPELRDPKNYAFTEVETIVERIAEQHKVRYLNLRPSVSELPPPTLWVTPPDPHPSVAAHEAFAGALFGFFDAELRARKK